MNLITAVEIVSEGIIVVFSDGDISYFPALALQRYQDDLGFRAIGDLPLDA